MKILKSLWAAIVALALIYLFNNPIGPAPALGKFFSPFHGFLQNTTLNEEQSEEIFMPGVSEEVKVVYDERYVPHVFAQNEQDLYYAQGYLMAKDRLWQMEFYTLVSAGRLTEVVGETAFEYDRYNRRLGMARAAEKIAEKQKTDPKTWNTMTAFSDGVNDYIKQLKERNLPVEYKILGYKPEEWSPYKTILMLMNMRHTLNGMSDDFRMTNILSQYGIETVENLFPNYPGTESPIIPAGTKWSFEAEKVNEPEVKLPDLNGELLSHYITPVNPNIGSNNWVIAGSRSATGLPILENDPHLGLSLPSIWYEMQLSAPGVNVYGVALPGCPGIIIGFNKDIAWGVTNVGSDVMDFYAIEFKDETKQEYWYDNAWKPTETYIEEFKLKSGKIITDTLIYTHHGPVVYNEDKESNFTKDAPAGHAMKWIAHYDQGFDLMTFYNLNRAENYDDYREALSYYAAPAQNFIFASNQNDIGITPNGKLPIKWEEQGKFILDGSNPEHDWQGYIPFEQNPTIKNPDRGFVSSANQFSADKDYPYYLAWHFAPPYRGLRINDQLSKMYNATADSLLALQNDNYNLRAEKLLPTLIPILEEVTSDAEKQAVNLLKEWDLENDVYSVAASIFETWMPVLEKEIWDDEFPKDQNMMYPMSDRTDLLIIREPDARWYDNIHTKDAVETIHDVVKASFDKTIQKLTLEHGPINQETWAWYKVKSTKIKHLVPNFTSFSRLNIKNGGGGDIVNATSEEFGPSWRMIVELDKEWPRAYGVYPGGQSGHPSSKYYDNMIDTWEKGELYPLRFMKNKDEKLEKIVKNVIINPKK